MSQRVQRFGVTALDQRRFQVLFVNEIKRQVMKNRNTLGVSYVPKLLRCPLSNLTLHRSLTQTPDESIYSLG